MKILQYIHVHINDSITQISHYNNFHFYRYAHFRYPKCLSGCNGTRTRKHLVRKRTHSHLANLAFALSCLFWARSFLTFSKYRVQFLSNRVCNMIKTLIQREMFVYKYTEPIEYVKDQLIKCHSCPHIETGQLIWRANQLTGFCMTATLTTFNGLTTKNFQGIIFMLTRVYMVIFREAI